MTPRALPHSAAVMVTFTASGLVHHLLAALLSHRLNPFVTVWFVLYGAVTVPAKRCTWTCGAFPRRPGWWSTSPIWSAAMSWSAPCCRSGYHRPMTTAMRRFGCPPARCGLAGAFGMA
jgi:hypothetical protein